MRFHSRRERLLWLGVALYTGFLYATAYFIQFLLDYLDDRGVVGVAVSGCFVVAAALIGGWLVSRRPGGPEVALLIAAGTIYAVVILHLEIPQERLHFIQYGVLAGLVDAALLERRRAVTIELGVEPGWGRWSPLMAIALTAAIGWGDEGVQYLLPNRYYDLRDVAFNAGAGALLVVVAATRRRLRAARARRQRSSLQ